MEELDQREKAGHPNVMQEELNGGKCSMLSRYQYLRLVA
jgi:hypothetical protein